MRNLVNMFTGPLSSNGHIHRNIVIMLLVKDVKGSCRGPLKILFQYLYARIEREKLRKINGQNIWSPDKSSGSSIRYKP
jgi:hypothetical protein